MSSPTILLLGASGQIGRALRRQALPEGWKLAGPSRAELDITNPSAVRDAVQRGKPDIIINAAALTCVDKLEAEQDLEAAMVTNFHAPANLAAQATALDIPMIQLSCDDVFDGRDAKPIHPDDAMNPQNIYGHSKLMGEEALRHQNSWHVILRTSSVFSAWGDNILTKILRQIEDRDEIRTVSDQQICPTAAPDIAAALVTISKTILNGKSNGFGTFHLCGTPPCTPHEFTESVLEAAAAYTQRRPKLTPTPAIILADRAPRPAYAVLDCAKIKAIYDIDQRSWREGLTEAMGEFYESLKGQSS